MTARMKRHSLNPLRKVFPIFTMPEPTGRYGIGTFEDHLIDQQRSETKRGTLPIENPKRREVPITVWYPTFANHVERLEPEYYPRSLGECISLVFRLPKVLFRHLSQVKTHTFRSVPLASDQSSYPVLLFSPGIRSTRFQSLTLIEEWVSRGYIVVGMDHPYTSGRVTLADRSVATYQHEPEFAESSLLYDYNVKEIAVRAADASFVMDILEQWNTSESGHLLSGKMDLNQVGIVGHSYGGATAAEAMVNDKRFAAALSLEGGFWGKVSHTPLERPFLYLFTGETAKSLNPDHPNKESVFYTEWREDAEWVMTNSRSDTWFATVEPFYHQSFTDISLVSPKIFAKTLSPERTIEITRSYTTVFFDQYLKGISSELLGHNDIRFPEVRYAPAYSQRRRD